jgi:hypothetical protein
LEEQASKKQKKHGKEKTEASDPIQIVDDELETPKVKKHKKDKKDKKEKKNKKTEGEVEDAEFVDLTTPVKPKSKEVDNSDVRISTPMATSQDHSGEAYEETGGAKYWRRLDVEKYQDVVSGTKYADNSHYAKGGDAWGNDAADRLGKVRGKGFKKEMQKLKRASWKGTGSIDTGVNSVQFSDWED